MKTRSLLLRKLTRACLPVSAIAILAGNLVFGPRDAFASDACLDLASAVRAGLKASESVQISNVVVDEAGAQLDQAMAGILPSVALSGSVARQDVPSSPRTSPGFAPAGTQTGSRIVLTQPIFKGGREYALLRSARAQVDAGAAKAGGARIKAAREITGLYFNSLAAQAEVSSLTELSKLSERRLGEIKNRVAIGRSRATDGLGAEAQVSSARAQLDGAKIQLDSSLRQLGSATGSAVKSVCDLTVGALPVAGWDDIKAKVLARPDLMAERIALNIAAEGVKVARAGHMPNIDLSGNYYLKRADSRFSSGDWDVTLNASLPLFSGGGVNAAVREAKAREAQQALRQQQSERAASDEASDLWERYQSSRTQTALLEDSAAKSDAYYRRVAQDERMGLASSLETLQALNSSIDARRAAIRARVQLAQTWRILLLAMGEVGTES